MMNQFAAMDIHVSLAAEELFKLGPISVTNALLTGMAGMIVTAILLVWAAKRVKSGRKNFVVKLIQWAIEGFYSQTEEVIGDKEVARKVFPIAMTMFFAIVITYWTGALPGVGSITFGDTVLVRALPADLNFTFALAIITIVAVQVFAISKYGLFGNLGRYIRNPLKDPIGAFEGLLEFIGEFSRGTALSFRLFGNAFAGEVLLVIIAALTGYFASLALPLFLAFELFMGFIQAYVFFVLTIIFTSLALQGHGEEPVVDHPSADEVTNLSASG